MSPVPCAIFAPVNRVIPGSMLRRLALLALCLTGCSRESSDVDSDKELLVPLIKIAAGQEAGWISTQKEVKAAPVPFLVNIEFVSDPRYEGKSVEEALALLPADYPHDFVFLADERSVSEAGHPCLAVDLIGEKRNRFRSAAKHLASIENNLSLSNMEFEAFEKASKATGVYQGL
jgi:hypothetical protein